MKELLQKLVRIQSELKAPKNQRNNFGNYNYRNCEDILEAVKPFLQQESLVLTITDEIEIIGTRFYVKATATLTDGDYKFQTTAMAREEESQKGMAASQITGSSSSYARKYALNGLFLIDDTKDADSKDNTQQPEQKAPTKPDTLPAITQKALDAAVARLVKGENILDKMFQTYTLTDAQKTLLQSSLKK